MKRKITGILTMCLICINLIGCGAVTKVSAAELLDNEIDATEEIQEESIPEMLIRVALTSAIDNALKNAKQEIAEMKGEIN